MTLNVGKRDSKVVPTWKSWDDFYDEYDAWVRDYDASPASAGLFFSGGEILPDGSIILESKEFETIKLDIENDCGEITINDTEIPRTRADMHRLYKFNPQRDTRADIKGTRARRSDFYKEYVSDFDT